MNHTEIVIYDTPPIKVTDRRIVISKGKTPLGGFTSAQATFSTRNINLVTVDHRDSEASILSLVLMTLIFVPMLLIFAPMPALWWRWYSRVRVSIVSVSTTGTLIPIFTSPSREEADNLCAAINTSLINH